MNMNNINQYRKFILSLSVLTVIIICVISFIFIDSNIALTISILSVLLCSFIFMTDYLYNRYTDDLIEQLSLLIESLVEQQEKIIFPELEDTLLSRLQHQLLKLKEILVSQNKILENEKDQIKTLISDISHQIKTPVASAKAFSELLADDELSNDERREYTLILKQSLDKLTNLTNCMMKISRLESGIIELKPEKISINDIVLSAAKSVYSKAKEKNITVSFNDENNYESILDFNWTCEAVTNVLDNAVKYTPDNGFINIDITVYPSYIRLDIADSGIGISEEEQAKVFLRFYRGTHSSGAEGVGLGLYLAREIITMQNGYIKVSSNTNGSTFSLFFRKTN